MNTPFGSWKHASGNHDMKATNHTDRTYYIDPEEGHTTPPDADEIVARLRYHLRGTEDPYEMSEQEWDEAARECDIPVGAISGAIQGRALALWSQDHHADMVDAEKRDEIAWEDRENSTQGAGRCPPRE